MLPGALAKTVAAEQAIVMPPPSGPGIVSVVERRYDNAIEQQIHLNTSALTAGQNLLTVQMFGTASPFRYSSNNLTSKPVTNSAISVEMARAIPGVRMSKSAFYVQNSYGPFGYAFGRGTGNDLCMYGWQQIRSPAQSMSPIDNYGSIQIRVRVCDAGATEQKLLAFMYNFTINASVDSLGWNPYGTSAPLAPGMGLSGAPSYPRAQSLEPIVAPEMQRPSVVVRQSYPAARPQRPAQSPPASPRPSVMQMQSPAAYPPAPSRPDALTTPRVLVPSPTTLQASPGLSSGTSQVRSSVVVPGPSSCGTASGGSDASCR